MSESIPCPVCAHTETIRARQHDRERCDDDMALMRLIPGPSRHGAGGNPGMPGRYHDGVWVCQVCELRLNRPDAAILVDAALSSSHPGCDSFDGVMHLDARAALGGS